MDWKTIAGIAPIISALTAIVAAIFISRQIANIRRNREVDTLLKIIALADHDRTREAREWIRRDLNSKLTIHQLEADPEQVAKFGQAIHFFETIAVLVNRGYISKQLVFDKYGLLIAGSWNKLQNLIDDYRREYQTFDYGENFEELASKYDVWAKKTPLKVTKGERLRLRETRDLLNPKPKKE